MKIKLDFFNMIDIRSHIFKKCLFEKRMKLLFKYEIQIFCPIQNSLFSLRSIYQNQKVRHGH